MKRTMAALTAILISTALSVGIAMPAQAATTATDVYNILASHKNANGQATPVNDATLRQVAQAYANELAKADTGKAPSSSKPFPSVPSGYKGGTQIQGANSKGDADSIIEGWKARNGSIILNAGYNYLGTGIATGKSGAVYVVANYAKVTIPVAAPAPAPAPVVQAPVVRIPAPVVQAPAPVVQAPVVQAPAPAPVVAAPVAAPVVTPRATVAPAPAAKPKATPKPTVKPAPTVKPTPTPTATPSATATPIPTVTPGMSPKEVEKVKQEALRLQRTATAAEQKQWNKTLTTGGAIGFGVLGFLALIPLPFLREKKEQPLEQLPTLEIDDDDDDFMIGTRTK